MNIHRHPHYKPCENLRFAYSKLDDVHTKLDSLHVFLCQLDTPENSTYLQLADILEPIIGLMDEPLNFIDQHSSSKTKSDETQTRQAEHVEFSKHGHLSPDEEELLNNYRNASPHKKAQMQIDARR